MNKTTRTLCCFFFMLSGCVAPVGDGEDVALTSDELVRFSSRGQNTDESATFVPAGLGFTSAPQEVCWWDPSPQYQCPTAAGRVPTCPSCVCLNCKRKDFYVHQYARIELNTVNFNLTPTDLRPHVVMGTGNAWSPTQWVYREIDPADVIGSSTWISVPDEFAGQDVYVWFVQKYDGFSMPLPGALIPAP